jgi:hypothetical protein
VEYSNQIIARIRAFVKEWLSVSFKDIKDVYEVVDFQATL